MLSQGLFIPKGVWSEDWGSQPALGWGWARALVLLEHKCVKQ